MPARNSRSSRRPAPTPSGAFAAGLRAWVAKRPWFVRWPLRAAVPAAVCALAVAAVYSALAWRYDLDDLGRMPERSVVYDARGNELGRIHGENRTVVPLDEVSGWFLKALLAREDSRFESHGGVDWIGVARAMFRAVRDREIGQGASTITMQLARNSYNLTRAKSFHRKLLEIALTRRIEANRTKREILELYVNRIFFGTGIYGVERAAQSYFGKPAADLTLDESAMLAAIIRGPNRFSPFRHYEVAVSGRNMVLDRMVATGVLTEAEADAAKRAKTRVRPQPSPPGDSWALNAVRLDLSRLLDTRDIEEGGLRIFTTIDPDIQATAESELNRQLARTESSGGYRHPKYRGQNPDRVEGGDPGYLQGAVVVLENESGAVRGIVGGRDIRHTTFNRALQSKRQAGSTIKPLVYAAALEHSPLFPGMLVSDNRIAPGELPPGSGNFSPDNSDGTYRGLQPAWWGLAQSRNTMTVRIGELAGLETVAALAERAALPPDGAPSPQLFLGNLGVTLENLAAAYSAFPNGGMRCRPFLVDRIESADGELLYRSGVMSHRLVSEATAWMVCSMLERTMEPGGTGAAAREFGFRGLAGGKSGTTDNYRDAWFAGFTPRFTCGVWVGLDDPQPIAPRGYGSRLALPVWAAVMRKCDPGSRGAHWRIPDNLQRMDVCDLSGALAVPGCGRHARRVDLPPDHTRFGPCPIHGRH